MWREPGPLPEVFGHRPETSMTRVTVEDSTAGLGQPPRTGRPLVSGISFHDVSRLCTNSLAHGVPGQCVGRVALALVVCQPLATLTSCVALSAASSEDPT